MKSLIHSITAGCLLLIASCAVYVAPSLPNSNLKPDSAEQKKMVVGWSDTVISTNFSPTYHLLNRSYHLHNGGVFITRLAMRLRLP